MTTIHEDEWPIIQNLLPHGWADAARETKAFRRARYITDPGDLLRVLLFHGVHGGGLRETVALARAGGLAEMSQVALLKRLRTSGAWLRWIAKEISSELQPDRPSACPWRIRAVDSTSISGPMSEGTDWRIHYSINLTSLDCDWHELTDVHGGEALDRTPMAPGDLLLADRNYLTPSALNAAIRSKAHVLIRLRWRHILMSDMKGRPFHALQYAKRLKVGQVGDWPVKIRTENNAQVSGRVVVLRLSKHLAEKAKRRAERKSLKKKQEIQKDTLEAANFVMLFTTVPIKEMTTELALELYRCRWQIELAFKRLKQLLRIGRLPHKDEEAARSWILSKLVVAFLIEKLLRNSRSFSPWGYKISPSRAAV